jgi:hypothetical protein
LTIQSTNRYTIQLGYFGTSYNSNLLIKSNTIYGSSVMKATNSAYDSNNVSGIYPDGSKYGTYSGQSNGDAGLMDIQGSNHNIYISNNVHDFTNYNGRGIWTQGYTHDDVIEYNIITNITGSGLGMGIDLDGAGTVEWNYSVIGNTVIGASYAGIQLENAFNSLVQNNVVQNTGQAGIMDINYAAGSNSCPALNYQSYGNPYGDSNGDGSCKDELTHNKIIQNLITTTGNWNWGYGGIISFGSRGLTIQANTIYSTSSSGNAGINFQTDAQFADQTTIQDNIIMGGNGVNICSEYSLAIFAKNDHNLMYNGNSSNVFATGSSCTGTPETLAAFQAATGLGQGSIQANPLFASGTFQLSANSPAIDKGIDLEIASDILGNARPQGVGFDMGAYEYGGAISPTSTIVPTNTLVPFTATFTPTPIPTNTVAFTPTNTATRTSVPTSTFTPTNTPTFTLTNTETKTLTSTYTPTRTNTDTPTPTLTNTATETPTPAWDCNVTETNNQLVIICNR